MIVAGRSEWLSGGAAMLQYLNKGDALASIAGSCDFSAGRNPQPQEGTLSSANAKATVLDAKTIVLRGQKAESLQAAALFA